ncbi:MAG TPA: hypothetical protein VJV79_20035 [Polyangiaceae bacterium]|nr:hypothetical protein [Polyangiaceae bacterium]
MTDGAWLGGFRWLLLLVAGIPATTGCGNASDDRGPSGASGSAGTPQTIDDFSQRFASRYCQSIAGCCSRQGFATTNCETTLREQLRAQLQLTTSNPKIHFDTAAAEGCINGYAAALSACTDQVLFDKMNDDCNLLFEGTVPLGEQCGRSSECARSDRGGTSCTTGVCVLTTNSIDLYNAPHRERGETCGGTCDGTRRNSSCEVVNGADSGVGACWVEDGLACANGVCVPPAKVGEACVAIKHCEITAHCSGGVCVADTSSGRCSQNNQCLPATSICDYTLMMCVPLKANGEACDTSDECLGGECYLDRCRAWTVAAPGACLGVLDD